ncbi:SNF-5 protein [Aphelenchoides avenae]|nr:SNF-5 protein [Aphelenchus avenae]
MAETKRAQWDSGLLFIFTCVGYAVGLGNIWRFPSLAYENGGGAFLIPYLTCSMLIGFPMLYLEMSLGQFSNTGPAVVYGRIRPLFQDCSSQLEDRRCTEELGAINATGGAFYFNGTCYFGTDDTARELQKFVFQQLPAVSPAEEFFENYILEKTATMDSFGGFNLKVILALFVAWAITALVLAKGVKTMGKVSPFTATIPYVIIAILFVRSILLDGANIGLDYYLFKPDISTIWKPETWRAAATHVCYSLGIGFGGLQSLSSFNKRDNNCFKDALIITFADGFMSVFGGTAVFSVLGFMSKQLNAPIGTVVQSGTGLAFIAYPEAMSRMPMPALWSLLFFLMLFILGISSQFGLAEVMCTALYDQVPRFRKHKLFLSMGVCTVMFLCGLIMCTRAGIFYFNIFNDYSASFSLMMLIILELVLVIYIYGKLPKAYCANNYTDDLRSMFGPPRNAFSRFFGRTGHYVRFIWRFIAPIESAIIFVVALFTQIVYNMSYGKDKRLYVYPTWAIGVGWLITCIPLLALPVFAVYNYVKLKRQGKSAMELLRLQPKWPSFERYQKVKRPPVLTNYVHIVPVGDAAVKGWESPSDSTVHSGVSSVSVNSRPAVHHGQ